MNAEKCPCCPNHCQKEELGCQRGKEFFGNSNGDHELKNIQEQVIVDLRKCGHMLHHNRELNTQDILLNFSLEELNQLHELLSKINMK